MFLYILYSGLDSESAYQLMKFLKAYVNEAKGRRVILTIHQPSSIIWSLIDNVVLLSKGHLVYQGPRQNIEEFFAHCGSPTPPNFNPADHYVSAINDDFCLHTKDPEAWAADFDTWSRGRPKESWVKEAIENIKVAIQNIDDDKVARLEHGGRRRSSVIKLMMGMDDGKKEIETSRSGGLSTLVELIRRYLTNLFFNPGILGTRIAMYVMLALVIGALFWNLGYSTTYSSIQSRIALLFYCVAFFVFMSVAVLPFTVIERAIVNKEVKNGYYHPALYHAAQALASLPGTALLAFLTTLIIITMTKLNAPYWYFLNMFLALNCAEALAQLVSHVVPHFIIGMAGVAAVSKPITWAIYSLLALVKNLIFFSLVVATLAFLQLYGLFMLLQGFMIIPHQHVTVLSPLIRNIPANTKLFYSFYNKWDRVVAHSL